MIVGDRTSGNDEEKESDAAVALIVNDGQFLVIKRKQREGDPWSGDMALPGGFRKEGETPAEAARRESMEEVGIRPEILHFIGTYSSLRAKISVNVYLSKFTESIPPVAGPEVSEAFWVPFRMLQQGENCFNYGPYRIWGLTFRILRDYLST